MNCTTRNKTKSKRAFLNWTLILSNDTLYNLIKEKMENVFIELKWEDLQRWINKIEKLWYNKQDNRYGLKIENTWLIVWFTDWTYLTSKFTKEYYIWKWFKQLF